MSEPSDLSSRRQRLLFAGKLLLVVGGFVAAVTLGWFLRGWLPGGDVGTTEVVVQRPVRIDAPVTKGSLPNVLGLTLEEARQAYADAGVEPQALVVDSVPYVGGVGTVVDQRPGAASPVPRSGGRVTLRVAEPATMPDLVGVDGDEARKQLSAIGVSPTTTVRFDARVRPGQVAVTRPAAGARAQPEATLIVSEAPSSVLLADLEPLEEECSSDQEAELGGRTVDQALVCTVVGDQSQVRYATNRRVSGFETEVGLSGDAPAGARGRLVVRQGGKVVARFDLSSSPRKVRVPLAGGAPLTLVVSADDDEDEVEAVFADARIVGARSGIDALADEEMP